MKRYLMNSLGSVQRPVAVMLTLIPIGSLAVTYCILRWAVNMATYGSIGDPNVSGIFAGFGTLFRDYAIPVLVLTVVLAVLNLLCAFAMRPHRGPAMDRKYTELLRSC
jgi:hypothetical protein